MARFWDPRITVTSGPSARRPEHSDETYQLDRRQSEHRATPQLGCAVGYSKFPFCTLVLLLWSLSTSLWAAPIDDEITLLRAELAQLQQMPQEAKNHLDQLKFDGLNAEQQKRYLYVYQRVASLLRPQEVLAKSSANIWDLRGGVVLLLPLSGRYEPVGQQFLAGFLSVVPGNLKLNTVDTAQGNIVEAYQKAQAFGPSLILGPLVPEEVDALCEVPLGIPLLALNRTHNETTGQNCLMASPSPLWQIPKILSNLQQQYSQPTLLAIQAGKLSKNDQAWLENQGFNSQIISEGRFEEDWQSIMGWRSSLGRAAILQRQMDIDVETRGRARQDFGSILWFGDVAIAKQIPHLLDFMLIGDLPIHWLPAKRPDATLFKDTTSPWSGTVMHLSSSLLPKSGDKTQEDGMLYAYAQDVMSWLLMQAEQSTQSQDEPGVYQGNLGFYSLRGRVLELTPPAVKLR